MNFVNELVGLEIVSEARNPSHEYKSTIAEVMDYVDQNPNDDVFISFVELPSNKMKLTNPYKIDSQVKVGVNPGSGFNTPNGVYTFPVGRMSHTLGMFIETNIEKLISDKYDRDSYSFTQNDSPDFLAIDHHDDDDEEGYESFINKTSDPQSRTQIDDPTPVKANPNQPVALQITREFPRFYNNYYLGGGKHTNGEIIDSLVELMKDKKKYAHAVNQFVAETYWASNKEGKNKGAGAFGFFPYQSITGARHVAVLKSVVGPRDMKLIKAHLVPEPKSHLAGLKSRVIDRFPPMARKEGFDGTYLSALNDLMDYRTYMANVLSFASIISAKLKNLRKDVLPRLVFSLSTEQIDFTPFTLETEPTAKFGQKWVTDRLEIIEALAPLPYEPAAGDFGKAAAACQAIANVVTAISGHITPARLPELGYNGTFCEYSFSPNTQMKEKFLGLVENDPAVSAYCEETLLPMLGQMRERHGDVAISSDLIDNIRRILKAHPNQAVQTQLEDMNDSGSLTSLYQAELHHRFLTLNELNSITNYAPMAFDYTNSTVAGYVRTIQDHMNELETAASSGTEDLKSSYNKHNCIPDIGNNRAYSKANLEYDLNLLELFFVRAEMYWGDSDIPNAEKKAYFLSMVETIVKHQAKSAFKTPGGMLWAVTRAMSDKNFSKFKGYAEKKAEGQMKALLNSISMLSTQDVSESTTTNINVWAIILSNVLGYNWIGDMSGIGIIHENEPVQAVFLNKLGYKVLNILTNKKYTLLDSVRKYDKSATKSFAELFTDAVGEYVDTLIEASMKKTSDKFSGYDKETKSYDASKLLTDLFGEATPGTVEIEREYTAKISTMIKDFGLDVGNKDSLRMVVGEKVFVESMNKLVDFFSEREASFKKLDIKKFTNLGMFILDDKRLKTTSLGVLLGDTRQTINEQQPHGIGPMLPNADIAALVSKLTTEHDWLGFIEQGAIVPLGMLLVLSSISKGGVYMNPLGLMTQRVLATHNNTTSKTSKDRVKRLVSKLLEYAPELKQTTTYKKQMYSDAIGGTVARTNIFVKAVKASLVNLAKDWRVLKTSPEESHLIQMLLDDISSNYETANELYAVCHTAGSSDKVKEEISKYLNEGIFKDHQDKKYFVTNSIVYTLYNDVVRGKTDHALNGKNTPDNILVETVHGKTPSYAEVKKEDPDSAKYMRQMFELTVLQGLLDPGITARGGGSLPDTIDTARLGRGTRPERTLDPHSRDRHSPTAMANNHTGEPDSIYPDNANAIAASVRKDEPLAPIVKDSLGDADSMDLKEMADNYNDFFTKAGNKKEIGSAALTAEKLVPGFNVVQNYEKGRDKAFHSALSPKEIIGLYGKDSEERVSEEELGTLISKYVENKFTGLIHDLEGLGEYTSTSNQLLSYNFNTALDNFFLKYRGTMNENEAKAHGTITRFNTLSLLMQTNSPPRANKTEVPLVIDYYLMKLLDNKRSTTNGKYLESKGSKAVPASMKEQLTRGPVDRHFFQESSKLDDYHMDEMTSLGMKDTRLWESFIQTHPLTTELIEDFCGPKSGLVFGLLDRLELKALNSDEIRKAVLSRAGLVAERLNSVPGKFAEQHEWKYSDGELTCGKKTD